MGLSAYGDPNNNLPEFLNSNTIYSNNNLFCQERKLNRILFPELFDDQLTFQTRANLAYELQRASEKIFLEYASFVNKNSKIKNLVIGGGCALNILGVSAIKREFPEFNIFVDPIASDATHSIGMGIHYYNLIKMNGNLQKSNAFDSIYTGIEYSKEEMLEFKFTSIN
jgi:predicted NodU family carbamoyl transferase